MNQDKTEIFDELSQNDVSSADTQTEKGKAKSNKDKSLNLKFIWIVIK